MTGVTAMKYRGPVVVVAGDGRRWRPWRALAARPEISFFLVDMPPGAPRALYAIEDGFEVILIDRALPPVERLAALAHELVHVERGGSGHVAGLPPGLAVGVRREEARVDRIVAERLVPFDELAVAVARCCEVCGGVTAADIADEFGVPEYVAADALEQWMGRTA